MKIKLAYHREGLTVEVPEANLVAVVEDQALAPLEQPQDAVREALRRPTGSPPLGEVVAKRRAAGAKGAKKDFRAVVVISDITRPCPNHEILSPLLAELRAAGIEESSVTILIATGLHRATTAAEVVELVGPEVAARVEVVSHESWRPETLAPVGKTIYDTTVLMNRRWVEADLRILTGLVEPHMMAGWSGGRKGLCPGVCGEEMVKRFHATDMMGHPRALPGVIEGNPVNELSHAVAALCPPHFLVNVTVDRQVRLTGVFAGDWRAAWQEAVKHAERGARVAVAEPADIVISTSSGYPLDLTFYQSQKGLIAALPILKPGGTILYAMACAEGVGQEEFAAMCLRYQTLEAFMQDALARGYVEKDQWALQYLHKVCSKHEVLFYSSYLDWELQHRLFVTPVRSIEDGLARALAKHGREARIVVMPKGAYVLPYLS
jgi:nickel-dependent lactate racemase